MCQKGSCDCGKGNSCPVAYPTYPGSLRGYNGWSPQLAVEVDTVNPDPDGNDRDVLRLTGWYGGTGTTPTDYVGQYLGTTGFVPLIINGTNIRGARGVAGIDTTAWTIIDAGTLTFGNTFDTNDFDCESGCSYAITSLGGFISYKEIGTKTMLISFDLGGAASFNNAIESGDVRFSLKIPNAKINNTPNVGQCEFVPNIALASPSISRNLGTDFGVPINIVYSQSTAYLRMYACRIDNVAGSTTSNWSLRGSISIGIA